MKNPISKYLAKIGRKGGQSTSSIKAAAARKNGALGGRPKLYRETDAYQTMKDTIDGGDWKISFMEFVDGFRRNPSERLFLKNPRTLNPDPKLYALLQSICLELCREKKISPKGWLNKRAFLSKPWFVSGMKSLYAMAIKESPLSFRKNNIFVLENFMNRA